MGFKEKANKLARDFPVKENTKFYPSGSVVLDSVLGGGIPEGTYIEIASESGLGKSTIALHASKTVCSMGKGVVYLDYEQGVNQSQIEGIGLDEYKDDTFFWYQPVTFADGEDIINKLAYEEDLVYIIIDSVTSMLPEDMRDKSVEKIQPGLQARLASKFLLKYKSLARQEGVTFIFVNQMRYKLNFRGTSTMKAAGGNAQKFYSDIRLRMDKEDQLERKQNTLEGEEKVPYGANVGIWAKKNRYERPFVRAIATVIYGKGVSNLTAYYRWMQKQGMIYHKGGGYYKIQIGDVEEQVRGKNALLSWVKENKDVVKEYIEENGGFLLVADKKKDV